MSTDDITLRTKKDKLIRKYAVLRMEGLGEKADRKLNDVHRVSQSVRTLGRLVLKARETKPLVTLDSLLTPGNFDLVVSTTKSMAFAEEKPSPSLGKRIFHLLNTTVMVKMGDALRYEDDNRLQQANKFKKLLMGEWGFRVNSACQKKMNLAHLNKSAATELPLTEDLTALRDFILASMEKSCQELQTLASADEWANLAKLTMSRLILFNKRRRAEVKDLKVSDYKTRPNWKSHEITEIRKTVGEDDGASSERLVCYLHGRPVASMWSFYDF